MAEAEERAEAHHRELRSHLVNDGAVDDSIMAEAAARSAWTNPKCYRCDPADADPFLMMVGLCYRHAYELQQERDDLAEVVGRLARLLRR